MSADGRFGGLRWRPRTFLFLATGAIAVVVAVAVRNPLPLFLGLALLVAPAAAALSGPRRDPHATLVWGETGSRGEVRLAGTVTPEAGVPSAELLVGLERPPALAEVAPATLRVGEGAIDFERRWGAHEPTMAVVPPPTVVWRDPGGFTERDVAVPAEEIVVVRYPPELTRLDAMRLDRTTMLPGETRSRRLGASGEFFGLRPVAPGDPPRRINWKASARAGTLLVNDFALERTGDVVLLLDARPTDLGPSVDEHLLSIARATAEGIAESLLRSKARVGLGVYGEFLEAVPLSMGRTQRIRVRTALLGTRLARTAGPSERCAVAMRRFFPPGTTTILLSPLAGAEAIALVPHLRLRGYPLVVLSPSPAPLLRAASRLGAEDEAIAARLVMLVRRQRIARSWQDAPTVDWDDFGSLEGFVRLVERPASRRVA